jgi:hypothetical protein
VVVSFQENNLLVEKTEIWKRYFYLKEGNRLILSRLLFSFDYSNKFFSLALLVFLQCANQRVCLGYCYHAVNVISVSRSQSEHIKWRRLSYLEKNNCVSLSQQLYADLFNFLSFYYLFVYKIMWTKYFIIEKKPFSSQI